MNYGNPDDWKHTVSNDAEGLEWYDSGSYHKVPTRSSIWPDSSNAANIV